MWLNAFQMILFLEIVAEACGSRRESELNMELFFGSNFYSRLKRCVTNAPFVVQIKERLRCVSCFFNKQEESRELLSSYFRCLTRSANKDCVSSMAGTSCAKKRKLELK